jgi:lipoprotein-anchoring transpeptidase ErfK/SrfK
MTAGELPERRMRNEDVIDLCGRVKIGTKVVVI